MIKQAKNGDETIRVEYMGSRKLHACEEALMEVMAGVCAMIIRYNSGSAEQFGGDASKFHDDMSHVPCGPTMEMIGVITRGTHTIGKKLEMAESATRECIRLIEEEGMTPGDALAKMLNEVKKFQDNEEK